MNGLSGTQLSLTERKAVFYEMLKEIDKACNERGLKYFLSYGTMLGAIRHKGFIPWDDDMDIMMPYQDFLKLANSYHSERYSIVWCGNNKETPFAFARMYDNRTYDKIGKFHGLGIGVDLYLIMGVPDSKAAQEKLIKKLNRVISIRIFLMRLRSFLAHRNLWPFKNLDFRLLNKACIKEVKLFEPDYTKVKFAHILAGETQLVESKFLIDTINVPFEDGMFSVPRDYDKLLRHWYGNYMQLPPEEKRVPYHGGLMYWK